MEKETLKTIGGAIAVIVCLVLIGFAWGHNSDNQWEMLPIEKKIEKIEFNRSHDKHCSSDEPNYVLACNKQYDDFIQEVIDQENAKY